ncbi:MAG: SLBB domain-containing protein [Armatimonadetes bacterium]|nr:SLBB domain-containing protein [Armatimonadota bacterium]
MIRLAILAPALLLASLVCGENQDYVLGAGDVIAITVFDHAELSIVGVQVRPDGKIAHPFLGEMAVAGVTTKELADAVAVGLKDELKDPIVTVNVTGFRENRVYVLGQVHSPGAFPADTPLTIAKAIALAGDLTERADKNQATLIPKDGEPRTVDLEKALSSPEGPGVSLKAGDTLIVLPVRKATVVVWGEVAKPGKYEVPMGQNTVFNAIAAVGGLTPNADRREATLIHADGTVEKVDLVAIFEDHDPKADVVLKDGDVITVLPHRNEVMVLGAVNKQGPVNIIPGDRLSDVIALTGGFPETADTQNVRVVRDADTVFIVNTRAILKDYNMAANIEVKPGDTIFVPEIRREVLVFGSVNSPGNYPIREGDHLLDVLARAGGFLKDKASPAKTALVRLEGQEAKVYLVDANEVIRGRQIEKNFELRNRDVIIVPERTDIDWREMVGLLFQAATMVRIFE